MEIALLPQNVLRIKGKQNALFINPTPKQQTPVAIIIGSGSHEKHQAEMVIIDSPGEYEVGGIRLSGTRALDDTVFSLIVDDIDILLGTLAAFEKGQSKLKEHSVVIVLTQTVREASFMTAFASNVLLFYGEKSDEIGNSFEKEDVHTLSKYQTSLEKLPAEMEIIRLA